MATVLVELKNAGAADIDAIDAVMAEAFDARFGEAWTRAQCLGMLALPGVWLTLAQVDGAGAVAGFALTRVVADEAELLLLAVTPGHRRHGIGRRLLGAAMAEAGERGAVAMHLEMRAGNDAAGLYRAAGFAQVGERRDYYRGTAGQSFAATTLKRSLSPARQ